MMAEFERFNKLLLTKSTALLIIDLQERILSVINEYRSVIQNSLKLIKGFKVMDLAIFYTEQYPKGLGPTNSEIKNELTDAVYFEKMSFSCFGANNLFNRIKEKKLSQLVVVGVETHVCVQQTVLDLLANKMQVNVAANAVSSRKEIDHSIAIERMRSHGAEITTTEAVLFELLNVCGTDNFKQISKIIK